MGLVLKTVDKSLKGFKQSEIRFALHKNSDSVKANWHWGAVDPKETVEKHLQ